jgi:predicted phospho-2-dehydro-3-deoxyheptonate aldolase
MNGKEIRLARILDRGKAVIVPMDHGTTDGPIDGLVNPNQIVPRLVEGGATAILAHKGILKRLREVPGCGVIMHLSASTKFSADPNNKVQVALVEEAVRQGADGVSIHVNLGGCKAEPEMLRALGETARACEELQMPLLAMMYPRGENIKEKPEAVALVARVGAELGADIVKTVYTGDQDSFREVVEGCPAPIVIAGGPKCEDDREVLQMVKEAMEAGAIGVSLGRNVFQHRNPVAMLKALRAIIIKGESVERSLEMLEIW